MAVAPGAFFSCVVGLWGLCGGGDTVIEAAAGNILQKAGVPAGDAVLHRQPKPRRYGGLGDIEYLRYHRIQFLRGHVRAVADHQMDRLAQVIVPDAAGTDTKDVK